MIMNFGVVNTTVQTIASVVNWVKDVSGYYTTNSLAEVSKLTRVEPLTILSKDLINLEYMPDIQNSLLNVFSAYYLQAVNIMTKIHDIEVIRLLDRLNPDRDGTGFMLSEGKTGRHQENSSLFSMEAYKHSLPMTCVVSIATEDESKNSMSDINNLAVGKMLNVTIGFDTTNPNVSDKNNPRTVNLQVAVRLAASVVPDATILHLLSSKTEDNSITERYHAWRSGRISFIKDLIFTQDLIDEWKRASIGDSTDTVQEIIRRVNNSNKFGLLTKNPSLVSASNLFVLSEPTARDVESQLGGKLSNFKTREKAFDNTYAMIIAVVDREYERVTFYTRGTMASTDVSIKEIKASNKSKGPDIADLMRAMSIGSPMSF
jgi:hypothetical protein